jgi:hypothetical protein
LGDSFPIESIKILNRKCDDPSDFVGYLCRWSHAAIPYWMMMESGKWVSAMLACNTCQVVLDVEHVFEASPDYFA